MSAGAGAPGTTAAPPDNVSLRLRSWAAEVPGRCAVRGPDGRTNSFGELDARCDAIAHGLRGLGLAPGDRACLFVRPGPELLAITHALFRTGVVPVLIDPGMGRKSLLSCISRMSPRALIGVPRAHVARMLFPRSFRSVEVNVTVGRRLGWGGAALADVEALGRSRGAFSVPDAGSEPAAVLFTSGSTGPPKGVTYTHRTFAAELESLRRLYELSPGEVDVACFPLFALFDNALGMTSIFPELDPSRPALCDPRKIHATIEESRATFTFGSPAIWRRVTAWARVRGKRFTTLRRITIAGAPVSPSLVADLRGLLPPGGEVHTPYGATEALPVSSISGTELAEVRHRVESGEGSCVGRPVPDVDVAFLEITDEPVRELAEGRLVGPGEPGEVCVSGPVVTREYALDPVATSAAKCHDAGGRLWHRMGDVGRLDEAGRLWLLGRKSHRLETAGGTLLPVPLENAFNVVEGVHRSALVGRGPRGAEVPYLVVEPEPRVDRAGLEGRLAARRGELARAGAAGPGEDRAGSVEGFLFHPGFPVDVRHNAKIHRGELKRWAEGRPR